ncbi:MAG TPA: MgtC/SapB family protein [Candidatus Saccharicenans sp.]|jgi:putative Mg2+ transporter-C (MgtC) family protein|nr:MgtC/SapB family protein [Candidatus Saccharicenans sp.]HRD01530.1 MgtC/SapB family protein [Candidatus Saccharicenans sp.]
MNILEIILKLILAIALGGLIGLERESSQKPAGFRTNIMVCLGSTIMMSMAAGLIKGSSASPDSLIRMAAGVVTGIGFLGAGTIIHSRGAVIGLTTASTLWVVAGLGLLIGAGYYIPAIIFTIMVIATLVTFRKVEEVYLKKHIYRYHLRFREQPELLSKLRKLSFHHGVRLEHLSLKKEGSSMVISFTAVGSEDKEQEFNEAVLDLGELEEFQLD